MSSHISQSSQAILMVRPANFGYNPQTAVSNAFQNQLSHLSQGEIQARASKEFDVFVALLRINGVKVVVYKEPFHPDRRDAIFPNNWISFHDDGRVVLYPMESESRRIERNFEVLELLKEEYDITSIDDLSFWEQKNKYLEGTGSIIFDYEHHYAYACRSSRTDETIFAHLCAMFHAEPVLFDAVDINGKPIYHTNVMLAIGTGYAVVCLSSIVDLTERKEVVRSLEVNGHEIVDIDFRQLAAFAGNMLEVTSNDGRKILVMSQTAYNSLEEDQVKTLEKYATLLPISIPIIEQVGGGSTRCMMAAINLPKKAPKKVN